MTFKVGQKVVCVDAAGARLLTQSAIYTVLALNEFVHVDCEPDAFNSRGYLHSRFRPIVERKTDISVFKKMLNPKGVDA